MREFINPVFEYDIKINHTELGEMKFKVLAINYEWALTIIPREWNITELELSRAWPEPVAMAQYGARDVSSESSATYLNYHAKPIK